MIIIPARIGSNRFPNKVLVDINGIPMVVRTAKAVEEVDDVVIATDSERVMKVAKKHKIEAIMTSKTHQSGTDRIYEASQKLNLDREEIIINVQGDEPFIEQEVVQTVLELTKKNASDNNIIMNSCFKLIDGLEAENPNIVKVVVDKDGRAIYFSRAKIPYFRDNTFSHYKGHIGIYGFTKKSLSIFCKLNPSPLEKIEKLEQLRALDYHYNIGMVEVQSNSFGIDTLEDLKKILKK